MINALFSALVILLLSVAGVSASSSAYDIDAVYVNGINPGTNGKVQVELGEKASILVYLHGTGTRDNVRVKAWLGGYEYGSIEAYTDVFDIEDGVSYKKTLSLAIPEDLDVEDHEYTLHIVVYDDTATEERTYTLYVEQQRHNVAVEDILLSYPTVTPGQYLGVKVRLENHGEKDEEDLRITVSIPEWSISNSVYLDELASGDQENGPTAYLVIPTNAKPGEYNVLVSVEYDNGYTSLYGETAIAVEGTARDADDIAVSVSHLTDLHVGDEETLKVQVTNLQDETKTFSLSVDGLNTAYNGSLTVPAGTSGTFVVTVLPNEAGDEQLFLEIRTDDGLVFQKVYTAAVEEKQTPWVAIGSIIFILLIIIGILFTKKRTNVK